ncbi:unknown (plasmid) [Haloarcula marismortui ATCC 43049]|uniref:Uncharacterized protein n=1 Tax=Haloarcula marismortui (strain ATCC 43049 / DSM 3752 / JCM 8966 / VKM B-1809) TaxID=272569 RepID=Q5V6T0_HALMA|nr:unknown [Haloarcula marismortui ATCC 43049]
MTTEPIHSVSDMAAVPAPRATDRSLFRSIDGDRLTMSLQTLRYATAELSGSAYRI